MIRRVLIAGATSLALGSVLLVAQIKPVPRPPAQVPGQPPPGESAAADGYAPIPQWLGQTRAAVLPVASATLSAADRKLENLKVLLASGEGTGGRLTQANDGTLLVTSSIPAGLGIKSEEWMQPQQPDSLMGKIMRINADGSIP